MANETIYPYGPGGQLPSSIGIINDLTTGGADKALAAQQGVVLNKKVNEITGDFLDELVWSNGYIDTTGLLKTSSVSKFSQPFILKAGCTIIVGTKNKNTTIIATTSADSVVVGDTVTPSRVSTSDDFITFGYTVYADTKIVIGVRTAEYSLECYDENSLQGQLDEGVGTVVRVTSDYFNLHASNGTMIRANVYLPIGSGCLLIIRKKATTSYYHAVTSFSVSEHTPTATAIYSYLGVSNTAIIPAGGNYFLLMFKNGNSDAAVNVSDILDAYDITVIYKDKIERPSLNEGEKRWDLFGALAQGANLVLSDYLSIPKQFMTVRFSMPEWMRVRFNYGLREVAGWTGYYYNGDTATFTREQSAIAAEISLIDSRGVNPNAYDRDAVGNWVSFAILDENDGDVISRNNDAEKYLGAARTTPDVAEDLPVIVHTSDIHGDARRFNSVCDYADHLRADLLVNTGDNPFYQMTNGILFHKEIVLAHKTDFANCIGNHDTYTSSMSTVYNQNILPFADDYGYHKATSSDVTDKCYFFKDLSSINVRVIALDIYDGLTNAAYKARVSQTQMEWFIATLASTPAGYGVVVIMHQAPHTISAITGKTDFNDSTMEPQIAAIDSDYMTNGKITGNPFGKIIDAFIAGGTVSGSYTQKTTGSSSETISYSADFSGLAEGVEFIAYLNGHTHRDFIGYVSDCEHNQLNLNIASAAPISQSSGYKTPSDIYRDTVGANQDAFNVYTINRTDKTVGVARIGSNLSKDLRPRKVMFVRYADDE